MSDFFDGDEDNRSEFEWEKEIRLDDERVHDYLKELPRYIDLPDEDKVIYKRIRHNDPQNFHGGDFGGDDFSPDNPEDEPDVTDEDFIKQKDGADVYNTASRLAMELCEYFASLEDKDVSRTMVRAMTLVGKIMARSVDIVRLDEGDLLTFRIALTKRFLADVNDLLGEIEQLPDPVREIYTDEVFELRDLILKKLRDYRHSVSGNETKQ